MNAGLYYGQVVIGPAGSGKSTYCKVMQQMAQTLKRRIIIFNLDPAAEYNQYNCDIDIQQLITLEDVMQEMQLGPNGGLLFCMEYLLQNQQWLNEQLSIVGQDDYVIFDCPGQIELYNDQDVFRQFVKFLQNFGFSLISIFMMDVNFLNEQNKFLSGVLQALSTQIALELPAITVLSKCDLLPQNDTVQKYIQYFNDQNPYQQYWKKIKQKTEKEQQQEQQEEGKQKPVKKQKIEKQVPQAIKEYNKLFESIHNVLHSNDITSIRALNVSDEDSIRDLLLQADNAIQYGQNLQPDDKMYDQADQQIIENMNGMSLE